MAQERKRQGRHLRLLAKRYGITVGKGVALVCVALVALLGVAGMLRITSSSATVVERASDSAKGKTDNAQSNAGDEAAKMSGANKTADSSETWVHVDGAVAVPGVYSIHVPEPRVNDAIELAGGLSSDADTANLNLAAPLSDGQKIYVPHEGEEALAPQQGAGDVPSAAPSSSAGADGGLVNINTANEEELQTLPGVGEATASAIVEERESGGPFANPEDLMRVSGIGEKKFAKMKDKICV